MEFSFLERFKHLDKKTDVKNSTEHLHLSTEDIIYAQKMIKFGIWTYIITNQQFAISEEIHHIYEDDIKNNFTDFVSYLHPEDKEKVMQKIEEMFDGKAYDIEFRIITRENKIKFLREKVDIFHDEDGKAEKIIGLLQDITDQKLLSEDLVSINEELYSEERIEGVGKWKFNRLKDQYYLSEELYNIYDLKPDEFQNDYRNLVKIIHPEDHHILEKIIKTVEKGKQSQEEYRIFVKDGSVKHLRINSNGVFDSKGKAIIIYGSVKDITEEKKLQSELKDKQSQVQSVQKGYQNIIRESKDGFLVVNKENRIRFISESTEKIIECHSSKVIHQGITKLFAEKESKIILRMIDQLLINPEQNLESEVNFTCKDGKEKTLEIFMRNEFNDPSINGILLIMRDITQEKLLEKKLLYDANHDQLTGLINRSCFLEKLNHLEKDAEESNQSYLLMLIYINDLKDIDLSFGFEVGNQLILDMVERIQSILPNDVIFSRYSEDNFALIINKSLINQSLSNLAEEIIDLMSESFKIKSYELFLKINIGACVFPNDSHKQLSLKDSVKLALLRSKKLGANRYNFYSSELNIQYYKTFTLRRDLKNAIKNKELEVYYQPLINIEDSRVVAAEALLRWNHPEWGLVSPAEFIPIAEESGAIIDIGKWILDEIFDDYKIWMKKGYPKINVGMNFSAIQFFEKDFVKKLKKRIKKHQIDPSFFIVEITENILMKNIEKINQDLKDLKEIGIRIALDDFGTGYSSLSYLNSLNIDILKIDKSFISGIPSDFVGTAITKATIKLAKELNLEIVAEGIETIQQLNYLKENAADIAQGYLYSRPVNEEKFQGILLRKYCNAKVTDASVLDSEKERRQFFRLEFEHYLKTEMTIQKIAGKEIHIGYNSAIIKNIGPGGMCFISDVHFPVEKNLVFKFMTQLNNEKLTILGHPIQSKVIDNLSEKSKKTLYEYRIEFLLEDEELHFLTHLLNEVEDQISNEDFYQNKNFTSLSYTEYFA